MLFCNNQQPQLLSLIYHGRICGLKPQGQALICQGLFDLVADPLRQAELEPSTRYKIGAKYQCVGVDTHLTLDTI